MVIKSRRGWVKIIEASIGALIVIAVLLLVVESRDIQMRNANPNAYSYLDEIAKNETFRERFFSMSDLEINSEIKLAFDSRIKPSKLNYAFNVCSGDVSCPLPSLSASDSPPSGVDIYSAERIISSSLNYVGDFKPKKIKLFLWRS